VSIVSEIKCARCDRKYSGVRSRCPYCGARRIGRGKYSEDSDNSKGKMLISVLVLGVLVVAAGFLLFSTPPVEAEEGNPPPTSPTGSLPDDGDNTSLENPNTPPPSTPPTVSDTPTPPPAPQVQSVTITYAGRAIKDNDLTEYVGNKLALGARVEPPGIEEVINWQSSDTGVFEIVPTSTDGTAATLTPIAKGVATLTVTVGGVESTCIIRIRVK